MRRGSLLRVLSLSRLRRQLPRQREPRGVVCRRGSAQREPRGGRRSLIPSSPVLRPKRRGFTGGTWFRPSDRARPAPRCRPAFPQKRPRSRGGSGGHFALGKKAPRRPFCPLSAGGKWTPFSAPAGAELSLRRTRGAPQSKPVANSLPQSPAATAPSSEGAKGTEDSPYTGEPIPAGNACQRGSDKKSSPQRLCLAGSFVSQSRMVTPSISSFSNSTRWCLV